MGKSEIVTVTVGLQYVLTVDSTPSGIPFSLEGVEYVTPWSSLLFEGSYIIEMPGSVVVNTTTYYFKQWEDGSTNPVRTVNLTVDTAITATYTTVKPPPWGVIAVFA